MEVLDAIYARRSIRKFKPDTVSEDAIKNILEAGRLAPSGTNLQPWRFVVVKSDEARSKLNECTPLPFVAKAPVVIACCIDMESFANTGQRMKELKEAGAFLGTPLDETKPDDYSKRRNMDEIAMRAYASLNVAIAIDHMTLRAVDLGLGSCWVMMFDQDKTKKALELEDKYNIVALIPVGYPDQNPAPRPRLSLDDIVIKEI